MPKMDGDFLLGVFVAIILAYLVGEFMAYIVRKYEKFSAPKGVKQREWKRVFKSPEGSLPLNSIIGYVETMSYFLVFSLGNPELIGGWLAFKVASKWQVWSNIIRLPEKIAETKALSYIEAKNKIASHTLQRWFLGNILNILAGAFAAMSAVSGWGFLIIVCGCVFVYIVVKNFHKTTAIRILGSWLYKPLKTIKSWGCSWAEEQGMLPQTPLSGSK